jgi:ubiquinone/menaquinone biosynthesis C-methylase UbiE
VIEETISTAQAVRFYDRLGRRHDWAERYESRAKQRALQLLELAPGLRVLDAGIGTGHDLARIATAVQPGGVAIGLDISATMLGVSRLRSSAALLRADCGTLPIASASLDRVFSAYVLDLVRLDGIAATLVEFHRVLRPGGLMALASLTSGVDPLSRTVVRLWTAMYARRPVALGGCRPVELTEAAEQAGFHVTLCEVVVQLGVPSEVLLARR